VNTTVTLSLVKGLLGQHLQSGRDSRMSGVVPVIDYSTYASNLSYVCLVMNTNADSLCWVLL